MQISKIVFTFALLVTGAIGLALSVIGCENRRALVDENPNSKILKTEQDFRDKIAELRMQRNKVKRHINRLDKGKRETVQYLREKGVKSSADLDLTDTDIKYALRKLKESKGSIDSLQKDLTYYDDAISSIKAMLDDMEREAIASSVALSEDDFVELRKIVVDLNERLEVDQEDPLEDSELAELLDSEFQADNPDAGGQQ